VLPVGRLQIFEMIGLVEIEVLEVFGEDDKRVADEKVSEMSGEK
jgi:hypothetical protein